MRNLTRRDATFLTSGALLASLLKPQLAMAYGTIPSGTDLAVSPEDAEQEMRSAWGKRLTETREYREQYTEIVRNYRHLASYFNSSPMEYRRHYANHWREESWWEDDHIDQCMCCFLALWHLCQGTSFERRYFASYVTSKRFSWHHRVTWRDGSSEHYVIDEWSRLRIYNRSTDSMTRGFDGWIYYEKGEYVALHRNESFARAIAPLSGTGPDWLKPGQRFIRYA